MKGFRVVFIWKAGLFSMRTEALVVAEQPSDAEKSVREAYPTLVRVERCTPNIQAVTKLREDRA